MSVYALILFIVTGIEVVARKCGCCKQCKENKPIRRNEPAFKSYRIKTNSLSLAGDCYFWYCLLAIGFFYFLAYGVSIHLTVPDDESLIYLIAPDPLNHCDFSYFNVTNSTDIDGDVTDVNPWCLFYICFVQNYMIITIVIIFISIMRHLWDIPSYRIRKQQVQMSCYQDMCRGSMKL
eukprot:191212_1